MTTEVGEVDRNNSSFDEDNEEQQMEQLQSLMHQVKELSLRNKVLLEEKEVIEQLLDEVDDDVEEKGERVEHLEKKHVQQARKLREKDEELVLLRSELLLLQEKVDQQNSHYHKTFPNNVADNNLIDNNDFASSFDKGCDTPSAEVKKLFDWDYNDGDGETPSKYCDAINESNTNNNNRDVQRNHIHLSDVEVVMEEPSIENDNKGEMNLHKEIVRFKKENDTQRRLLLLERELETRERELQLLHTDTIKKAQTIKLLQSKTLSQMDEIDELHSMNEQLLQQQNQIEQNNTNSSKGNSEEEDEDISLFEALSTAVGNEIDCNKHENSKRDNYIKGTTNVLFHGVGGNNYSTLKDRNGNDSVNASDASDDEFFDCDDNISQPPSTNTDSEDLPSNSYKTMLVSTNDNFESSDAISNTITSSPSSSSIINTSNNRKNKSKQQSVAWLMARIEDFLRGHPSTIQQILDHILTPLQLCPQEKRIAVTNLREILADMESKETIVFNIDNKRGLVAVLVKRS
eukprot:m.139587 g.139587  ORF g.139587 m.139587 type:complete len:516 (-) comp13171_c0_seq2:2932-4479(-)